jgi:hypothetical protein
MIFAKQLQILGVIDLGKRSKLELFPSKPTFLRAYLLLRYS